MDPSFHRQIRSQCNAFKRGLTSVVNAEWLRMFSCRELQLLISGAEVPIDLEDLKRNTHYAGELFLPPFHSESVKERQIQ